MRRACVFAMPTSAVSIFEEAQYRGVLAAERTLRRLGVRFSSSLVWRRHFSPHARTSLHRRNCTNAAVLRRCSPMPTRCVRCA